MTTKNSTDERIRWQNSQSQANAAVATLLWGAAIDQEDFKVLFTEMANFFYNVEPEITEMDKAIEEAKTLEDLENMKDAVKFTDSIRIFNLWNAKKISLAK